MHESRIKRDFFVKKSLFTYLNSFSTLYIRMIEDIISNIENLNSTYTLYFDFRAPDGSWWRHQNGVEKMTVNMEHKIYIKNAPITGGSFLTLRFLFSYKQNLETFHFSFSRKDVLEITRDHVLPSCRSHQPIEELKIIKSKLLRWFSRFYYS